MAGDTKYSGLYLKIVSSSSLNRFSESEPKAFVEVELKEKGNIQRTEVLTSFQPIWNKEFYFQIS